MVYCTSADAHVTNNRPVFLVMPFLWLQGKMCLKTKMAVYLKAGLRMDKAQTHQRMEQFAMVCTVC